VWSNVANAQVFSPEVRTSTTPTTVGVEGGTESLLAVVDSVAHYQTSHGVLAQPQVSTLFDSEVG